MEEEKFREITDANISTSPTLTRMMKTVLKAYERAGIIKLTPMSTSNELSKNLYHINITTTPSRTQLCADAKVEFTIYAPLPSMLCERIVNVHSDYILTSIRAGGKDSGDCRVLPPLYKLLTLPDNTTFSPCQFYTNSTRSHPGRTCLCEAHHESNGQEKELEHQTWIPSKDSEDSTNQTYHTGRH